MAATLVACQGRAAVVSPATPKPPAPAPAATQQEAQSLAQPSHHIRLWRLDWTTLGGPGPVRSARAEQASGTAAGWQLEQLTAQLAADPGAAAGGQLAAARAHWPTGSDELQLAEVRLDQGADHSLWAPRGSLQLADGQLQLGPHVGLRWAQWHGSAATAQLQGRTLTLQGAACAQRQPLESNEALP